MCVCVLMSVRGCVELGHVEQSLVPVCGNPLQCPEANICVALQLWESSAAVYHRSPHSPPTATPPPPPLCLSTDLPTVLPQPPLLCLHRAPSHTGSCLSALGYAKIKALDLQRSSIGYYVYLFPIKRGLTGLGSPPKTLFGISAPECLHVMSQLWVPLPT